MATHLDLAVLSAFAYKDVAGALNEILLPTVWKELPIAASDTMLGPMALHAIGATLGGQNNATIPSIHKCS